MNRIQWDLTLRVIWDAGNLCTPERTAYYKASFFYEVFITSDHSRRRTACEGTARATCSKRILSSDHSMLPRQVGPNKKLVCCVRKF